MPDSQQTHPILRPSDLSDPTLFQINSMFDFLYSQIAQTQGASGDSFHFKRAELNNTNIPSDDNSVLTLGAYKKLVAKAQPDTSSGLTLPVSDSTAIVKDDLDSSKQMRFEIGGFSIGATRVITPPDADIALANNNELVAHPNTTFTLSASYLDIPNLFVTLNKNGTWLILLTLDMTWQNANVGVQGQLLVNGVVQADDILGEITTGGGSEITIGQHWTYSNTGTNVAKIHAKDLVGSSGANINQTNTKLTAIFLHP
jgi:hypothetical protein